MDYELDIILTIRMNLLEIFSGNEKEDYEKYVSANELLNNLELLVRERANEFKELENEEQIQSEPKED